MFNRLIKLIRFNVLRSLEKKTQKVFLNEKHTDKVFMQDILKTYMFIKI